MEYRFVQDSGDSHAGTIGHARSWGKKGVGSLCWIALSARGGHYLHRSENQLELVSWLEGHGTIFKKDRRKPQLCTWKQTLPGCIPPGCAPRLYRVTFRPIIAQGVSPRDDHSSTH